MERISGGRENILIILPKLKANLRDHISNHYLPPTAIPYV